MQTANVMVAIGGGRDNTVPKYDVTAAEIAVLIALHGPGSVFDIEPQDDVERTNREELGRLRAEYGGAKDGDGNRVVDLLYPGAAARVLEDIDELEIDESFFKAEKRVSAKPAAKKTSSKKSSTKVAEAEGDDGIGEMNDGVLA